MRSFYRKGSRLRLVVATTLVVLMLSLTSAGYATPRVSTDAPASVDTTGTSAVAETTSEQAPAPAQPSEEGPPAESQEQAVSAGTAAPQTDETGTAASPEKPAPAFVPKKAQVADAGATAASKVTLRFEGYNRESAAWTKGNLGKAYEEGDWVAHRLIIDNSKSSTPYVVPALAAIVDHYNASGNVVFYDATRQWGYFLTPTVATNDTENPAVTDLTMAEKDVPTPSGGYGSAEHLRSSIAASSFTVPANTYGVVYFQAHLGVTAWWKQQTPSRNGAGHNSGSSGSARVDVSGEGAQNVPIPSVEAPGAFVRGFKFNDRNGNGMPDAGEEGLGGWTFHLHDGVDGFPIDVHAVSAADGTFSFGPLPGGSYTLSEDPKEPWYNTTGLPTVLTVEASQECSIDVGNRLPEVTKTFELTIGDPVPGATYFARYFIGDQSFDVPLTGSGPFTGSVELENGTSIRTEWYARMGGVDYLLGTSPLETLTADKTNRFEYDNSISGSKFNDANANGAWDDGEPGIADWGIQLWQDGELVASTLTAAGGGYVFRDLLPGTYEVREVSAGGWYNTAVPDSTIVVGNGTHAANVDFGNFCAGPGIDVTKTGPDHAYPGDEITYTVTVRNSGNTAINDIEVFDSLLGSIGTIASLAPGAEEVFYVPWTVAALPDPLPNTASAMGMPAFGGSPVSDTASWDVDVFHPQLAVDKSASVPAVVVGDEVLYTYVVANTGDVGLTDLVLDDDKLGAVAGPFDLDPGQVATFTASSALATSTTNIGTVEGTTVHDRSVRASDTVTVPAYSPSISVVKTASEVVILPGAEVEYTYLVTNTGDIALSNVVLIDDKLGPIGGPVTLLPGASMTFTKAAAIPDDVTNVATVTGEYGDQGSGFFGSVGDTDNAFVDVVEPAVAIDKSASVPAVVVGDEVLYTYVVTNMGDVPLVDVDVDDDKLGDIAGPFDLAVGQTATFTASATLTTSTTNVATVTGSDGHGHDVSATDTVTVPAYSPSISIAKSGTPTTVLEGEEVTYVYVVTNTGDIPLWGVTVEDDKLGPIGSVAMLLPGESMTFTHSAPIEVDTVNVGTATGYFGEQGSGFYGAVSDTDDEYVDVIGPAIRVTKSASVPAVVTGGSVTYTYLVENIGDVDLTNVSVDDDKLGHIGDIPTLLVGGQSTLEFTTTLTGSTTNVATVTGTTPTGGSVTDTDTVTVPVFDPAISVTKTADPTVVTSDEVVTYTYEVRNTGDVELDNVTLTDDKLGAIGGPIALQPNQSASFTATTTLSEDTTNVVDAVGTFGEEGSGFFGQVTHQAKASVDVVDPSIAIVKTSDANPEGVLFGETVTYVYEVTNTGDVPLVNVSVDDDKLGHIADIASLASGETQIVTAEFTIEDEELLGTVLVNVATATGADEFGHEVSAQDDEEIFIVPFLGFTTPDLRVEKKADRKSVKAGDLVRYTVTFENVGEASAVDFLIEDDFDEANATVVDADGGEVENGKITWFFEGPLDPEDGPQTLTYTVRIDNDLPSSVDSIDNVVVVESPDDENPDNDRASVSLPVTEEPLPFLPFTGGNFLLLVVAASLSAAGGVLLRRRAHAA